jgi:hypothetical protein
MNDKHLFSRVAVPGISFDSCDVPVAVTPLPEFTMRQAIERALSAPVEAASAPMQPVVKFPFASSNPFVMTVHYAFADHRPLVLSPDHIWLLICQGFAQHVNTNAETMRYVFVNHAAKKTLQVQRDDFIKGSPNNPWQEVFPAFTDQLRANLATDVHDLLMTPFSTTGSVEKAAFEVTLLDAFKAYFDYAMGTGCGIPSITLEGTPDDWRSIINRAERLKTFDLDWWLDHLLPILQEFANAAEGRINRAFWESIYKFEAVSGATFVTGWLVNFFPYIDATHFRSSHQSYERNPYLNQGHGDEAGRFSIGLAATGLSRTPFKWDVIKVDYAMEFVAGFIGATQNAETKALRPYIGWAVWDTGLWRDPRPKLSDFIK